jgi:aminomethyltransferase
MSFNEQYFSLRNKVCLFNLDALVKIKICGDNAEKFLDLLCPGNIKNLNQNKIINTVFLNEDGKILKIFWLMRDNESFIIHCETANKEGLMNHLKEKAPKEVFIEDISEKICCLSIVGPKSLALTKKIFGEDILGLPYLNVEESSMEDMKINICRYGGSGEFEYRILTDQKNLLKLERKIIEEGNEYEIISAQQTVLDLAWLEMKTINQDQDLIEATSPLQAGLHWMINFRKDNFQGKTSLENELREGVSPKLMMCIFEENGHRVFINDNKKAPIYLDKEKVGEIVNTNFSPTIKKEVGLAFIKKDYAYVDLEFEVRKTQGSHKVKTVSSPLFITRTVSGKDD